jgi:hypothetical protein
LVDTFLRRLRKPQSRITDRLELAAFLESRAAFVSQQCVTEFCRVRAGVHWEKLFRESDFQDALLRSGWLAFTPALAMLTEMAEGVLRLVSEAERLRGALTGLATEIRGGMRLPGQVPLEDWRAQDGLVADSLARAALAAPRPVRHLPDPLAKMVFDALPLHVSLLTNDFDYIFNNLRMNLLRAHEDFIAIADSGAIARSLSAA